MLILALKVALCMKVSMRTGSLFEPASSGHFRNCSFCHWLSLLIAYVTIWDIPSQEKQELLINTTLNFLKTPAYLWQSCKHHINLLIIINIKVRYQIECTSRPLWADSSSGGQSWWLWHLHEAATKQISVWDHIKVDTFTPVMLATVRKVAPRQGISSQNMILS